MIDQNRKDRIRLRMNLPSTEQKEINFDSSSSILVKDRDRERKELWYLCIWNEFRLIVDELSPRWQIWNAVNQPCGSIETGCNKSSIWLSRELWWLIVLSRSNNWLFSRNILRKKQILVQNPGFIFYSIYPSLFLINEQLFRETTYWY